MNVTAEPFPHIIIDGLIDDELLDEVLDEFPAPGHPHWRRYTAATEMGKHEASSPSVWGPATTRLYEGLDALAPMFAEEFGTPPLIIDSIGGGYHMTEPGGRLAVHTDFNRHGKLYRRLNVLVFLNREWERDWGGVLELHGADGAMIEVLPTWNRMIVFATSDHSWHGHPTPVAGDHYRRSFAAYYFTVEPPADYGGSEHSTVWHPSEGWNA